MAYWAMASEIDLRPVIDAALRQEKALLLPRCEENGTMTARQVYRLEDLRPGAFGIWEPGPELPEAAAERIDLILVPAMAYDRKGHRLGRGKGYYDRFLCRYDGKTIGVSGILLESVPVEAHDVSVDAVASESGLILCGLEDEADG